MSEPMKKLSIWLCVLLFMISAESRAQSMISGATYEKRCDAMIQYMARVHHLPEVILNIRVRIILHVYILITISHGR